MLPSFPKKPPLGRLGEDLVAQAYERAGARILARNHRSPLGEIDLLVEEDGVLVAVEVKTRTRNAAGEFPCGTPAESVTPARLLRLARSLEALAASIAIAPAARRIDVAEVVVDANRQLLDLTILRDVTS